MNNLNQDSPLSEQIKGLAQAQLPDDQRLQVLIYLTAELAARCATQDSKSAEGGNNNNVTVESSVPHESESSERTQRSGAAECPDCKFMDTVDICDKCGKNFGLSGQDHNGYNSSCVHCGNNTYTTQPCENAIHDSVVNSELKSEGEK